MSEEKQATPAAPESEVNTEKQETLETIVTEPEKVETKPEDEKYLGQKRRAEKAEERAEALQAEIQKLRTNSATGDMPITEVNNELKKLSEEYNVDETFVAKLYSTVEKSAINKIKAEIEKDYTPKIMKIEQERRLEQANSKFEELYSKTLKDMPEYDGIINKDVIKSLAFATSNGKKTLPQLIEETYGAAVQGRKSIESTHASKEPQAPNVVNPTKEDWDRIESDPTARQAWSKQAEEQIKNYL